MDAKQQWHDWVCLLGKPSTSIVTPEATKETGLKELGYSLDAGVCVGGWGGVESLEVSQVSGFLHQPYSIPRFQTFHTKQPDLSALNRSFAMLLLCSKTLSQCFLLQKYELKNCLPGPLLVPTLNPSTHFFSCYTTFHSLPPQCLEFSLEIFSAPSSEASLSFISFVQPSLVTLCLTDRCLFI